MSLDSKRRVLRIWLDWDLEPPAPDHRFSDLSAVLEVLDSAGIRAEFVLSDAAYRHFPLLHSRLVEEGHIPIRVRAAGETPADQTPRLEVDATKAGEFEPGQFRSWVDQGIKEGFAFVLPGSVA